VSRCMVFARHVDCRRSGITSGHPGTHLNSGNSGHNHLHPLCLNFAPR
jgi:hypothetical protein